MKPGSGRITVIGRVASESYVQAPGKVSVTVPPLESEGPLLVTSQEIYVVGLAGRGAAAIVSSWRLSAPAVKPQPSMVVVTVKCCCSSPLSVGRGGGTTVGGIGHCPG